MEFLFQSPGEDCQPRVAGVGGGCSGRMGVEWGLEQRDLAEQESGEREHTELNPG